MSANINPWLFVGAVLSAIAAKPGKLGDVARLYQDAVVPMLAVPPVPESYLAKHTS